MVINYNYNESTFRSRKIVIDTTSNTATIIGGSIYFTGETNEYYGSYQDNIDSSNDQYCAIIKTGALNKFIILKRNFPGLNDTGSYSSPSVTTTILKSDISASGNINSISNVLKLGNFLYFTINPGTSTSYDALCEFNLSTNSETFYNFTTTGRFYVNLEKIDDYHYIEVQHQISGNPIGTNMKIRLLRLLLPGILESPFSPVTVLPSQSGEFRNNYRFQSNRVYYNLNKNAFFVNSDLFCYFYKTSLNYRVALL
jgi:hypothetical protein